MAWRTAPTSPMRRRPAGASCRWEGARRSGLRAAVDIVFLCAENLGLRPALGLTGDTAERGDVPQEAVQVLLRPVVLGLLVRSDVDAQAAAGTFVDAQLTLDVGLLGVERALGQGRVCRRREGGGRGRLGNGRDGRRRPRLTPTRVNRVHETAAGFGATQGALGQFERALHPE